MKKLLWIVVLGSLLSGNVLAGVEEVIKEIKKNKDIAQGFKKQSSGHLATERPF